MKVERYSRAAVAGSTDLAAPRARAVSLAAKLPCWATPARPFMVVAPLGNMACPLLGARAQIARTPTFIAAEDPSQLRWG